MALHEYITGDDITHSHIKKFLGTDGMIAIISEANDHYEQEVAMSMLIESPEIQYPVGIIAMNYLRYYVTVRFSEDSIGCNGDEITEVDMYTNLVDRFTPELIKARAKLSYDVITGQTAPVTGSMTMRFGKAVRGS